MKKKLSILLVLTLIIFAFVPALTLAQDETEGSQEPVVEESEETTDSSQEGSQDTEESEEGYKNLEDLLADLETNDLLSNSEKVVLERKLTSYDENLDIDTMSSVVDKILNEEIDLGQGF